MSNRNLPHEATLCKAVNDKCTVQLKYKDEIMHRVFCPHAVFESSTGRFLVAGTQIEKDGVRTHPGEWQMFQIDRISNIDVITDLVFKPDPAFNSFDRGFYGDNVICAVDRPSL
ncbi:MAG: WYL domain-containing protein [Bacteroidota bacterium]